MTDATSVIDVACATALQSLFIIVVKNESG